MDAGVGEDAEHHYGVAFPEGEGTFEADYLGDCGGEVEEGEGAGGYLVHYFYAVEGGDDCFCCFGDGGGWVGSGFECYGLSVTV